MKLKLTLTAVFCVSLILCCSMETRSQEIAKYGGFSLDNFDGFVRENVTILWDEFEEHTVMRERPDSEHKIGDVWLEFKVNITGHITVEDDQYSRKVFFSFVAKKVSEQLQDGLLLKFVPFDDTDYSEDTRYFNLGSFTGTIYMYNKSGELDYYAGVTSGVVQSLKKNNGE